MVQEATTTWPVMIATDDGKVRCIGESRSTLEGMEMALAKGTGAGMVVPAKEFLEYIASQATMQKARQLVLSAILSGHIRCITGSSPDGPIKCYLLTPRFIRAIVQSEQN